VKLALIILLIAPILCNAQAKTADELINQDMKKYDLERLKVTYELSGGAEGAEMLVFEKYGWQSMRKQTMVFELYEIKTIQTLLEITDGDFIYRLNEGDSTMTTRNDYKWSQQASYKAPQDVSEAILFSMGGTHSSDTTLLNNKCQVWTFENKALQELWIWNGIMLKRKTKLGDQIIYTTATEIQKEFELGEGFFSIPTFMKEKE